MKKSHLHEPASAASVSQGLPFPKPWRITLTGIDAGCPLEELAYLSENYPTLEWAVLYSRERAGTGRYPSKEWIDLAYPVLANKGAHLALHVCGSAVAHLLEKGALPELRVLEQFERVQLNGHIPTTAASRLQALIDSGQNIFITQYDQNPLLAVAMGCPSRHQYLFDSSGGGGILRAHWPAALPAVRCGYGGGLSAENLAAQLPKIAAAAGAEPYWIDMETSLRTADDHFSTLKARKTLARVEEVSKSP